MTQPHQELSAAEVIVSLRDTDAVLLDVREQQEWDRGHSPLATLLPMSELQARIDEIPDDRRLFVVCRSGQRSGQVAAALTGVGYDAVNVSGGMIAWHAAGGDLVAEGAQTPRVD